MKTGRETGVGQEHRIAPATVGTSRSPWLVPLGLLVLGLVPLTQGAVRLSRLVRGGAASAANARFAAAPLPVALHIVGATLFCVLGALQFAPTLRARRWHRFAGRVVLPAGLVAALSGLWMAFFYELPAGEDDTVLEALRLVFGVAMVVALVRGWSTSLRRDIAAHRAWMMRAYAIGLGAGTQAFLMIPYWVMFGKPLGATRTLLMGAGWMINIIVAERRPSRS